MDEAEPGRLAIWRLRDNGEQFRLQIDLGYDWGVTLMIDRAGHAVATLSEHCTECLAAEVQHVH